MIGNLFASHGRRWVRWSAALLLLGSLSPALAWQRLPAEVMEKLPHPWPPSGWSEVLDLPGGKQSQPHRSEPRLGQGYFGQSLYQVKRGSSGYWTANVLIEDRGDPAAAWHAVSAAHGCKVRTYLGNRARECRRGGGYYSTKTLYFQTGRFYVTIQLSGPGEIEYPVFEVGAGDFPPVY